MLLIGEASDELGAALDAALRLAERIQEGVVVVVFPDAGDKYLGDRYWEEAI